MIKPSKFIEKLEPYKITPQDVWSDEAPNDLLKIDWNEAPELLSLYKSELKRVIQKRGITEWYPDYLSLKLNDAISKYIGINENNILTFPGSDVGLETLCRTYLNPEDEALAITPTYENFFVYVKQTGSNLKEFRLEKPFKLDFKKLRRAIEKSEKIKLIYIVNPNNPCGYILSNNDIVDLARQFPSKMFIVDEAYMEFSKTKSCALMEDNIVTFRTFSKGFGIAGLRLGYMCASSSIINNVNKIRNGKNVSMLAQYMGIYALNNIDKVNKWFNEVIESREYFCNWCKKNNITYYESHGNFVLFEVKNPSKIDSKLKSLGIYIRNRDSIIKGCVRVTIGSRKNAKTLINALEAMKGLL